MEILITALMEIIEHIDPGGLLVLCVAALGLHLSDLLGDHHEARQPAASTTTLNTTEA